MSAPRPPITPPDLEGYSFVRLLGSGGFSDVFLYKREFPEREVAIKVLLPEAVKDPDGRRFTAEANVMAKLSNHPYIVSIFEARVSDDGYPYLVMEYYPRPNFHVRARRERFSVAAVLRAGVQVAAAVETAHRHGVLHRDIKPANILTSEYGRPGLTDFGIASGEDARVVEAEGMSIPWSPPEIVAGDGVGTARSDVYSLGATLWTLLSGGRSPFEVSAGSNRSLDLIDRIERGNVAPVDRPDVPDSLQRLLAQTMAREPRARPATAAELARSLQVIEVEQRFDMTPFEVREEEAGPAPEGEAIDADAGATRVKGPAVIDAQGPDPTRRPRRGSDDEAYRPTASASAAAADRAAPPARPAGEMIASTPYVPPAPLVPGQEPVVRTPPPVETRPVVDHSAPAASSFDAPQAPPPEDGGRRRPVVALLVAAVVVLLLALVAGAALVVLGGDDDGGRDGTTTTTIDPAEAAPPPVEDVEIEALGDDEYLVTWTLPEGLLASDELEFTGNVEGTFPKTITDRPFTSSSSQVCVTITVVRDGKRSESVSNLECA